MRHWLIAYGLLLCVIQARAQDLQFVEFDHCDFAGGRLEDCRLAYRTLGKLNQDRSNAVLFPTWYTGTSEELLPSVAADGLVDPATYFVILVDAFGNGVSSSPSNTEGAFPAITIGDMVAAQRRLVTEVLKLDSLAAVIGISMGGMQTFEWVVRYPKLVRKAVPIAGSPRLAVYDMLVWPRVADRMRLRPGLRGVARHGPVAAVDPAIHCQQP